MAESPFLNPDPERVFYKSELAIGLWDAFPVSPGHALIVPRRVVPTWFEATREEQIALLDGIGPAGWSTSICCRSFPATWTAPRTCGSRWPSS